MLTNGSGWVHFAAFGLFWQHFLVYDGVMAGTKSSRKRQFLLYLLPWIIIPFFSGPYCGVYAVTLMTADLFLLAAGHLRQENVSREERREDIRAAVIRMACTFLPLALGSVLRIRLMDSGIVLVLLPFLASWLTDTFAYFTGKAIGKHHIVPHISPKKTLEGCIGGTVLCTAASLALVPIAKSIWNVELSMPVLALIMCLASILSQFGDLSMSYIKRGVGIKDYGKLMPGHGGVLDRFDSVLFAAPVVELCLHFLRIL